VEIYRGREEVFLPKIPGTIYVIDEDGSVRRAFGRLLRSANLKVEAFVSSDEFLSAPRQTENACILADIETLGATGFNLVEKMATEKMYLPVIVVSASDDIRLREQARKLGAASFFRKPVDDQALLDAIWWAISGTSKALLGCEPAGLPA
jgi:FixJ family two-component response regulator